MIETSLNARGTDWECFRSALQAEVLAATPEHIERLAWSAERIRAAQREGLHRLLAYALEHSPFHRRRLARIDVDRIDPSDLSRLPVMTKADMMASLDDVFTDRRLGHDLVERTLAATGTVPIPILGEYVAHASGGSSGQRGVFVYDRAGLLGVVLSVSRPLAARLQALGGPPPGGLPIAMVAAASAVHMTGAAPANTAGRSDVPFHFIPVPVTAPLSEIVERLNALQPPAVFGYPSMLVRLAAEQRAGRLRIHPLAVTSTSETLLPEVRAVITEAFGVPVVDTFGSTEGLFGSSPPGDEVLTFNSDLCIVELVDANDQPVAPGAPSAKVLLTNLYNRIQPLIRYELTDSFVRQRDAREHGHLRAIVRGRSDEVLRYGDVDVHPLVVRSVMVKSPEILDYQVRQTRRGVDVVAVARSADVTSLTDRLAAALARAGLERPEVHVRIVPDLDRHHETGKLRRFVPLPAE